MAKKITASETILKAGYGETRQAAILFTDIRGFTKASATLSPTALISLLNEYQCLLVPIIQKHHGNIDKFMGDGIMASFGAVVPSDTYAADALNAVDEIINALKAWNQQGNSNIEIGMGLSCGEIIFGVMGNEERLEYTVIGEAANLAAKLEKQNKVENSRALTTEATLEIAIQQGYVNNIPKSHLNGCSVSGVKEPVNLVVLA